MFGSVGAWFYRALAGIRMEPDTAAYQHIRIEPRLVEDLHWASGTLHTIRGTVSSSWNHSPGKITLDVTIPVGADAVILVPKEEEMTTVTVHEGNHTVWENGQYVPGDPGIQNAQAADDGVTFRVGSGHYAFVLTGE